MIRNIFIYILILLGFVSFGNIINSNISGRSILMNGSKSSPFPDGIVPIEYVETTANDQYIDIEYVPKSCNITFQVTYVRTHSNGYAFAGYGSNRSGINFFLYSGNGCVASYGNAAYNIWDGTLGGVDNHLIVTLGNGKAIAMNVERGVVIEQDLPYYDFSSNQKSFWILKSNGANFDTPLGLRFCDCTIIVADGEIAMDIVPVRVKDVGYVFDKVSQQLFENKGSGYLKLGPDL